MWCVASMWSLGSASAGGCVVSDRLNADGMNGDEDAEARGADDSQMLTGMERSLSRQNTELHPE